MESHVEPGKVSPAEVSFAATSLVCDMLLCLGREARWSVESVDFLIGRIGIGGVRPQPLPPPPPPPAFIEDLVRNLTGRF